MLGWTAGFEAQRETVARLGGWMVPEEQDVAIIGESTLLYLQKDQAFPQLQRPLMGQHSHCGAKAMTRSHLGP